jgi:hypothetical protein
MYFISRLLSIHTKSALNVNCEDRCVGCSDYRHSWIVLAQHGIRNPYHCIMCWYSVSWEWILERKEFWNWHRCPQGMGQKVVTSSPSDNYSFAHTYWQSARSVIAGKLDKRLRLLSIFIVRKLSIGLIIWYVSLNITGRIIPKPSIFTGTGTQDRFWVSDLCSCNLLAETNNFCLGAIILSCLVSKLQQHSHRDSDPK